jgi:AraC-like DNA-binding protein
MLLQSVARDPSVGSLRAGWYGRPLRAVRGAGRPVSGSSGEPQHRQRLVDGAVGHARGRMPDRRSDVALAQPARPRATVEDAADAGGWSVRQLRRQCVANVGLAPKPLQQVLRFPRALRSLGTEQPARVAAEHGNADQAHLPRAVRRHAGATPRELATRMAR